MSVSCVSDTEFDQFQASLEATVVAGWYAFREKRYSWRCGRSMGV